MNFIKTFIIFISILGLFYSCNNDEISTEPININFVEYQEIDTNSGLDWESFSIDDNHFLAIANRYNGATYNLNSKIYDWNGYTFTLYQDIETNGASDWEYFCIENENYLMVANYYNNSTHIINSIIYKWDINTNQFVSYQSILTSGARDLEFFTIGNDYFLAIANSFTGATHNLNSEIYKWNGTNFILYQNIQTNGAFSWKYFVINEVSFLAVSNYYNGITHNINSNIYKWNTETELFELHQEIITNSATDWEYFSFEENHFIVVANSYSDSSSSYNTDSIIYKWDSGIQEFDLYQQIATNAASDWEYFSIENDHFLVVANAYDGLTYEVNSVIFQWDSSNEQFNIYQEFETIGAIDWEYFSIENDLFLSVANHSNDSTYNTISIIYKGLN